MKAKYHKYPALLKALNKRADIYNEQRLFCQKLEKEKAIVLLPSEPIEISRYEKGFRYPNGNLRYGLYRRNETYE